MTTKPVRASIHGLIYAACFVCVSVMGLCSLARAQTTSTTLMLISTVHAPTVAYTEDSLYQLLTRAHPDVILLEFDSSFFDSTGQLKKQFEQLTLETKAAVRYRSTSVLLAPYDIEGRNAYYSKTNYFEREQAMHAAMSRMYTSGSLRGEARALYEALRDFGSLRDSFSVSTPATLNSSACDAAMERKQRYAFDGISRIIALTPELADFAAFWKEASAFWTRRNNSMVTHILSTSARNPGRSIVVLCGFEHRYYLRSALSALQSPNFLLREP